MRINLLEKFETRHRKKSGPTLVVGSHVYGPREDRRKRYREAVGVDMVPGEGVDWVCDLANETMGSVQLYDHVDCISVLEHCAKPWEVAKNIEYLMNPGGTLLLTVPFAWWVHAYPSDYWRFTTEAVRSIFPRIEWAELLYANLKLTDNGKLPSLFDEEEHRYLARTEVYGFGARRI